MYMYIQVITRIGNSNVKLLSFHQNKDYLRYACYVIVFAS